MKSAATMRLWFAFMAAILWTGIYLTGFGQVNGLMYVPAIGFTAAGLFGYCPSQIAIFRLFGNK